MSATAEQVTQLRRMTAEPTSSPTYSDADLQGYIEAHPVMDARGELPYTWDTATTPPAQTANPNWVAAYDLHAAAADVWEEKAAVYAGLFDFKADGSDFSRSQAYEQMMARVRYHRARRATATMRAVQHPKETATDTPWIGNLPEPDLP
jgi:hypothetical protein